MTLIDDFMPVYDVSDSVATVVEADPDIAWAALMDVDLIELGRREPVVGVLGALRALPEFASYVLHGLRPPAAPDQLRLRELAELPAAGGGWALLGHRPPEELALGLVGRFWRPVISYAEVAPEQFRDFSEPGYAKTIYSLSAEPLAGGRTLLSGTMRTATTDEHAQRWFRRYWTLGVGSGAHLLVSGLLDRAREIAEQRAAPAREDGQVEEVTP
jgi:hypothetical protein